ncbi:hypothetical protein SAMN05660199_04633 [Klenkia soli]|uniref:Uncharacterized protein n=1 Tax=Klenkia soli TaxID=1052260 RepID=A0A1H0UTI9_9ACTN|nr:hypothetical protein [Klenkia soli]SDP69532.1 hypothetical protein SAMN05660199_04633 [Klenkia soli]
MIIALLSAWVVAGLLLALLVGAAVRIADQRYQLTAAVAVPVEQPEVGRAVAA